MDSVSPLIARNPCGAKMICGVPQKSLAYAPVVGGKKREVTGEDRAIGARIRIQRQRLGVSVTELGLAFGGSRQKVQFWERGENFPPVSDFARLCSLLRADPNHILLGAPLAKDLSDKDVKAARLEIQSAAIRARTEALQSGRHLHHRARKTA